MSRRAPDLPGSESITVNEIARAANRQLERLFRHRERYVKAWIAATGLHPTECVLVETKRMDGSIEVSIHAKKPYIQEP